MKVMTTDPIADLLTRIRNAQMAKHTKCVIPYSKMKESIVAILKNHNYIQNFSLQGETIEKTITVVLQEKPYRNVFKRISTPGQRIYRSNGEVRPVQSGLGIAIYSTSKGVIDNLEAKKLHVGGELLCEIW
jgi:small subunit ribosomal protein S8